MTAKSVLVRPQGLRPRARAPNCPPCYVTALKCVMVLKDKTLKLRTLID